MNLTLEEALFRNVSQIIPSREELTKKMSEGRIRIYLGIDVSAPNLTIGSLAILKKLKAFQSLGHEIILLVGGSTGAIGDPDKLDVRRQLNEEEVTFNSESIKKQVSKVLTFEGENPAKIVNNQDWFSQMKLPEMLKFLSFVTYDQIIERDRFQERIKKGLPIYLHEFMYPVMQGIDSLLLDVDMEIGGNDQMFNMMVGRDLQHKIQKKNKFVLTINLLTDSQGQKIGKSLGNGVLFADGNPYGTYAGIMSLEDEVIIKMMVAITEIGLEEISIFETEMKEGQNPMKYKKLLAYTVVKENYSEAVAKECQHEFEKTVQSKDFSENQTIEIGFTPNERLIDFLKRALPEISASRIKEVIVQGGIEIDGVKELDLNRVIVQNSKIKFGKRNFLKVK